MPNKENFQIHVGDNYKIFNSQLFKTLENKKWFDKKMKWGCKRQTSIGASISDESNRFTCVGDAGVVLFEFLEDGFGVFSSTACIHIKQ